MLGINLRDRISKEENNTQRAKVENAIEKTAKAK